MATFGDISDGTSHASVEDSIKGTEYDCLEAGIANFLQLRVGLANAGHMKAALYKVTGKEFVAETEELYITTTGIKTFNFPDPKPPVEATKYIIVGWADSDIRIRYESSGAHLRHSDSEPYDGFPDPLVSSTAAYRYCGLCDYTPSGQVHEINVDAVVKASAEKSLQTTYNIQKNAVVAGSAVHGQETTFNIPKDAIIKSLADLGIETTFNISKDALVQTLADVVVEKVAGAVIEIFKDAIVQSQATFSLESTFNINKNAVAQATSLVNVETIFNVVKDAIVKASATPQVLGIYPIYVDAGVKASATASLQQTLGISKDAVVVAVSTPLIQSTFNISKDAVVKVLAEVTVVKEGEAKVTKLFLILGNIGIQLTGD